jgi:hypothetical protein
MYWQEAILEATGSIAANGFGFRAEKQFGWFPEPSKNPPLSFLAGETQTCTRQPMGFAGFA